MSHISVMIKPASSLCNMRCTYCFYSDVTKRRETKNYGMMTCDTAQSIVDNVFAALIAGDAATLVFQGGEPTLAGLNFFKNIFSYATECSKVRDIKLDYALQTNGTIIDEEWASLLREHPVLVGLSIDCYKQLHDCYRRSSEGGDTYNSVMRTKHMLDEHKIPYNILATLTNQAARHPQKIWQFLLKEKIEYVQFTPCLDSLGSLDSLDKKNRSVHALAPERFYSFNSAMFSLWIKYTEEGHNLSIKLFDDLVNYFEYGILTACGINGSCGLQFVCEGNGSVFPCDFYVLDEHRMGSLADSKLSELVSNASGFLSGAREYVFDEPCRSCNYNKACRGGCKRMVDAMYISGGICWYAKLLDEILAPLLMIASRRR